MAGHLPIKLDEDKKLEIIINKIVDNKSFKKSAYFETINIHGVKIKRLSKEWKLEKGTGEIFTILKWHYKEGSEDEFEGCNIEVHLTPDNKIKQVYLVA